jgi:hypothetical protein
MLLPLALWCLQEDYRKRQCVYKTELPRGAILLALHHRRVVPSARTSFESGTVSPTLITTCHYWCGLILDDNPPIHLRAQCQMRATALSPLYKPAHQPCPSAWACRSQKNNVVANHAADNVSNPPNQNLARAPATLPHVMAAHHACSKTQASTGLNARKLSCSGSAGARPRPARRRARRSQFSSHVSVAAMPKIVDMHMLLLRGRARPDQAPRNPLAAQPSDNKRQTSESDPLRAGPQPGGKRWRSRAADATAAAAARFPPRPLKCAAGWGAPLGRAPLGRAPLNPPDRRCAGSRQPVPLPLFARSPGGGATWAWTAPLLQATNATTRKQLATNTWARLTARSRRPCA